MNILFFISISLYMKIIPYYYSNHLKIKHTNIKQITGIYPIFDYNPQQDIYRYGSKKRRSYKREKWVKKGEQILRIRRKELYDAFCKSFGMYGHEISSCIVDENHICVERCIYNVYK